MREERPRRFSGLLDAAKIAEGMNAALANARRLAADAHSMLLAERYPTAVALAVLSIEESGKVSILRELALASDVVEARHIWKRYRSHTAKNEMWIFPQLVADGRRHLDEFSAVVDPASDHPDVLDKLKQVSVYSDCYGKARWHLPERAFDPGPAAGLVQTAQLFCGGGEITPREIELWIKHMKPVWKVSPAWQRKALANWYAEMQAEGLAPQGENQMESFIWGSPPEPPEEGG